MAGKNFCVRRGKRRPFPICPRHRTPPARGIRLQHNLRGEVELPLANYVTVSLAISRSKRRTGVFLLWLVNRLRASADCLHDVVSSAKRLGTLIELRAAAAADVEHFR